jgi:glycosyltransferase involved in cell wall biosynthesis
VLFVAHSAFQGGAELCLDTILKHVDQSIYEVFAVFPWEGPLTESTRQFGIPVEIIPLMWWMNWPRSVWYYKNILARSIPNVFRLVRLIKKQRIDLVYTNTVSIWESALAARLAGVRHIWHCHEVLGPGTTKHHLLPMWLHYKLIERLSHRIIFESESSRKTCAYLKDNPKCEVVYNSLRFSPDVLETPCNGDRQRFGLRQEDRVVAFIGQFCERKNPFALLRAIARIRHVDGLRCLLVGNGPLGDALTREIEVLGLERICSLIDFQPDVSVIMRCIDLLVLPSREESFGLVLVEAGALGKPVIATRTQGPTEIVVDGETGFLVDVDNEVQLAEKIETLLSCESERQRMGTAASRRVHELFSAARNTRKVEQVIDDVLG